MSQTLYAGPTAEDLERIPAVLKARPQWVLWRAADRLDAGTGAVVGIEKIPINLHTLRGASTTDSDDWGTFEECVAALPLALEEWETDDPARYRGGGIGYVFTSDDPYTGVDLDHCRDPQTDTIAAWAQTWIDQLSSYTQVSVSGTGIHCIVEATLPPRHRQSGDYQMWDHARFFAMTGQNIPGTPTTIELRQIPMTALWCTLFAPKIGQPVWCIDEHGCITNPTPLTITAIESAPSGELYARFAESPTGRLLVRCELAPGNGQSSTTPALEDARILELACQAKNGAKFTALWQGDWTGYPSQSEADLALCIRLAFWTQDATQIDRLFRQSGLMRPKWADRPDYQERTIQAALTLQTEHYTPPHGVQLLVTTPAQQNGHTSTPSWRTTLITTKSGEIRETFSNVAMVLMHMNPWQTDAWYDVVRETPMIGTVPLCDQEVAAAALAIGEQFKVPIHNLRLVQSAMVYLCRQRPRDPLQEWLATLPPWDGIARLGKWLREYAGASDTPYTIAISRLLPVSMVARALRPGCQYRNVVILEGPEDIGKSKLVKALAGPEWYREVSHGLEGKEAHMIIQGAWVAELAELSSLTKTEEARLKSFITMESDDYIPKFSNLPVSRKRRTVFVGTVNPEGDGTYLRGQTGNTRYLPLPVTAIDIAGVLAIREQLLAEALAYYRNHPDDWWQLTPTEATEAQRAREDRRQRSVYQDSLALWLDGKDTTTWEDIAKNFLLLEAKEKWKDRSLQMEIAKALRALSWKNRVTTVAGRSVRRWVAPHVTTT